MTYDFISRERYTDTSEIVRFKLNGRDSVVVRPDNPLPGNPTVWRTEYFEAFDAVDKEMLKRGWHICHHNVRSMYGSPTALTYLHEFYEFAKQTFNLAAKPVLFGFSVGGLFAVNYAASYGDEIGALYLDAPVLDIHDWPCRKELRDNPWWRDCMKWYGLTEQTLDSFAAIPLAKTEAVAHLPIIIVAGLVDTVVRWERNGSIFVKKLEALGANLKVILKPDCDHHPHSVEDPLPVADFICENILR